MKNHLPKALHGFADMNLGGWIILAIFAGVLVYGVWTGTMLTTGEPYPL